MFYLRRKCGARFGEQGAETSNMTPLQWCAAQSKLDGGAGNWRTDMNGLNLSNRLDPWALAFLITLVRRPGARPLILPPN
jgi:hypothetical protein